MVECVFHVIMQYRAVVIFMAFMVLCFVCSSSRCQSCMESFCTWEPPLWKVFRWVIAHHIQSLEAQINSTAFTPHSPCTPVKGCVFTSMCVSTFMHCVCMCVCVCVCVCVCTRQHQWTRGWPQCLGSRALPFLWVFVLVALSCVTMQAHVNFHI